MKTSLKKWGNSYALRLPKSIIEELKLKENETLYISSKANKLIIEPESKEQKLDKMLEGMTKQTEIDWGKPRGKEFW